MPKQIRHRRGTTAQHATFTGAEAEVTYDTDKRCIVVHDGVTQGGHPLDAVRLNPPGGSLASQSIQSGLNVLGEGDANLGLYVLKNAQVDGSFYTQGPVFLNQGVYVAGVARITGAFATPLQRIPEDETFASPYALDFGSFPGYKFTLSANLTFTTTGLEPGRRLTLVLIGDSTLRTLTWPAGWRWVGATAPASLAANKVAWLELLSTTTADSGVLARWTVES